MTPHYNSTDYPDNVHLLKECKHKFTPTDIIYTLLDKVRAIEQLWNTIQKYDARVKTNKN